MTTAVCSRCDSRLQPSVWLLVDGHLHRECPVCAWQAPYSTAIDAAPVPIARHVLRAPERPASGGNAALGVAIWLLSLWSLAAVAYWTWREVMR